MPSHRPHLSGVTFAPRPLSKSAALASNRSGFIAIPKPAPIANQTTSSKVRLSNVNRHYTLLYPTTPCQDYEAARQHYLNGGAMLVGSRGSNEWLTIQDVVPNTIVVLAFGQDNLQRWFKTP